MTRKVGVSTQRFVCAASYVRAHGAPRRLADLARHTVIGRGGGGPIATMLADLRRAGTRVAFSSTDIESVYLAVCDGLGVALLPGWLTAADLASGRLVQCVSDNPAVDASISLVRPEAGWLTQRARTVFDAVADGIAAALRAP